VSSVVESISRTLDQVRERNPGLNCFITVDDAGALASAAAADQRLADGTGRSALDGVAIAVKDCSLWSMTGQPSLSLPFGTASSGMPVGLLVTGKRGQDALVIQAAGALEGRCLYDAAMTLELTEIEARVIGCLVEKERTTPDQYPLSTNALTAACNQKTSRDPVMDVTETEVDAAMLGLREKGLARSLKPSGSRAWKHRQVVSELLDIDDAQLALLAILLLRGPQTAGELRTRSERMVALNGVDDAETVLLALSTMDPPLARNIGRGPGQSQDRWRHAIPVDRGARGGTQGHGHLGAFRQLHTAGLFVMPNPWDVGSALRLEACGFTALATTSAGHARSIGKNDQELTRDELLTHVEALTRVLEVPLNVDSERLYARDAGGIAETVRLLAAAGAAGCSIEDYDPRSTSIDSLPHAIDAVAEAAAACADHGLLLTARAENHLYGVDDLDDTIERLKAFAGAGADVVYAPGLVQLDDIELLVSEVPVPVNVLFQGRGPSIPELEAVGVRRVSVGGALFNAAYRVIEAAAEELLGAGTGEWTRPNR
jgi:2-methylisocitrate lyase-like PEP mutase family enzyme/uncharacterized protein YceH (UPF0502 family)